jgi:DNA-nicking Smr family endonuclease
MNKLPPDEVELFRDAVRDVRQQPVKRAAPKQPKPIPRARFTRADQQQVLHESLLPITATAELETGDELSFRRDDVSPRILRKLRSGEYTVGADIDLHGLTASEARVVLRTFVADALLQGKTCIRIVHGKGRGSGPRGPVLKNVVNIWLRQCDAVRAFGSARPMDGGNGAVYVLLKK